MTSIEKIETLLAELQAAVLELKLSGRTGTMPQSESEVVERVVSQSLRGRILRYMRKHRIVLESLAINHIKNKPHAVIKNEISEMLNDGLIRVVTEGEMGRARWISITDKGMGEL